MLLIADRATEYAIPICMYGDWVISRAFITPCAHAVQRGRVIAVSVGLSVCLSVCLSAPQ